VGKDPVLFQLEFNATLIHIWHSVFAFTCRSGTFEDCEWFHWVEVVGNELKVCRTEQERVLVLQ
jgi:hypothetical protein